jgi:hypothetical protein
MWAVVADGSLFCCSTSTRINTFINSAPVKFSVDCVIMMNAYFLCNAIAEVCIRDEHHGREMFL